LCCRSVILFISCAQLFPSHRPLICRHPCFVPILSLKSRAFRHHQIHDSWRSARSHHCITTIIIFSTAQAFLPFNWDPLISSSLLDLGLRKSHGAILQSTPGLTLWLCAELSPKPTILSIFIHSWPRLRACNPCASGLRLWQFRWESGVWSGRVRGRLWCKRRCVCQWQDGRTGRVKDGVVGCVWDRRL